MSFYVSAQISDVDLTALGELSTTGVVVRTGNGTATTRSITGTANQITVTNGDGVAGAPTLSTPQNIHTGASPTFAAMTLTAALTVANGGTGLASGTSGGVPYFSATTTIASSGLLTANALVLGGGAGAAPTPMGSLGTTTTVLHGNAAGAPTFGAVSLTADVSGILPTANGGTGMAFFTVAGPTVARIYTFPDAAATVLTTNAAVTVAQGGTGIASGTSGGVPYYSATTTIASSGLLTASAIVLGGGAGAAPTSLALGTANQVVGMNSGATAHEYKSFAVGTTGTDFAVAHSANTVTFNLPDASATARGAVTTGTQTFAGAKTFTGTVVLSGVVQHTATRARLASAVTNVTTTLANLTELSLTLVAGRKYTGTLVLPINQALAADGFKLDLGGGTVTFTAIQFGFDSALGSTIGVRTSTTATTAITLTALTDTSDIFVTVQITLEVNAGGTFIPRQAKNSDAAGGTLTLRAGGYLWLEDTP